MGHKVHPNAFRLGVFRPWEANWFANPKDYTKMLHEDLEMRRVILARLRNAGIAKIETERSSNAQLTVTIHTAKPGIVIGKGGASVDQLREDLEKRFGNRVRISIQEIKQPELDAQLEFSPKHAAKDVAKAIKSAAANAEHNFNLNRDDLVLKQILIDEGPTFRRRRPVSRSMAHEFFHRTCHITAVVEDRPEGAK